MRIILALTALVMTATPVLAGKEYCRARASDNVVLGIVESKTQPVDTATEIFRPVQYGNMTAVDNVTEVREVSTAISGANCVVSYATRAKTAQEMNATRDMYLQDWGEIERRLAFDQENRIRALERYARAVNSAQATASGIPAAGAAPALTPAQFAAFIRGLF